MKMKAVAVFFAVKFFVSMSGVDGGMATAPVESKPEAEMSMVVGSTNNGKEADGSGNESD
jgi:hypothetical protein